MEAFPQPGIKRTRGKKTWVSETEEEWRPMARFQGYQISSLGNILDWRGDVVEPYYNEKDELCVHLQRYEWSFNGPLWMQMLRNFWLGNRDGISFYYEDGDQYNLDVNNLTPIIYDENGNPKRVKTRIDIAGNRVIDKRLNTQKIKIVETGDIFDTVSECAEAIDGNSTQIYSVLRGRAKSHRGFTFEAVDEF